jgi:two-component system, cell cycle response regulator
MPPQTPSPTPAQGVEVNQLYLAAAKRFEALFDGVPIACLTFDQHGTVFEWNQAAEELWEKSSAEVFQRPLQDALNNPHRDAMLDGALEKVFQGENVRAVEWKAEFGGGRSKWVVANLFPMQTANGETHCAVMACVDITAQKELQEVVETQLLELSQAKVLLEFQRDELAEVNAKLEALATTDGLTGLKNHRAFQEFFEQQFQIAKRAGNWPLSVVLLDVDNFKNLNDEHGHQAGDDVLRELAKTMLSIARKSDFVARYGGEEFVVVLPGTDIQGCAEAAERMRQAVEKLVLPTGPLTVSVGGSTVHPRDQMREQVIARADAALYAAKRAGRNKTFHSQDLAA